MAFEMGLLTEAHTCSRNCSKSFPLLLLTEFPGWTSGVKSVFVLQSGAMYRLFISRAVHCLLDGCFLFAGC